MVACRQFAATLPAAIVIIIAASGCSIRSWWGEKPVPPQSIKAPISTNVCPSSKLIFKGTEEESQKAFDCVADKAAKIWDQIETAEPFALNDGEIASLIRNRVVVVDGDPEAMVTRALTAKNFLGFKGSITKAQLDDWLSWAGANRAVVRDIYQRYQTIAESAEKGVPIRERLTYADLRAIMQIAATGLRKLNMRLDSESFAHSIVTILDVEDKDLRHAATPAAEAAINLLNNLCPTFSEKDVWSSKSISSCLVLAADHFKAGAAWFEFMANPIYDLPRQQTWEIEQAMAALSGQVRSWFSQPTLAPIYTARWLELARRLGARPPENLIDSLAIIRNFGGESTKDAIHPEAMPYLFNIVVQAQDLILKGMPYYLQAVKEGNCVDPKTLYWTSCVLKDYSRFDTARESWALNLALTVKNLKNGVRGSPLDGRRFSRIMAMHSIAGRLIDVFDPLDDPEHKGQRDHYISMSVTDPSDAGFLFITSAIMTGDTISRFVESIRRKLNHLPLPDEVAVDVGNWDIAGLARLVAITNEILVRRPPETKNVVEGILANLTNLNPESNKLFLDQLSLTAILSTLTSLKDFRLSYLGNPNPLAPELNDEVPDHDIQSTTSSLLYNFDTKAKIFKVNRESLIRALPEILRIDFPRTAVACEKFGFNKSCGVTFDEMLPTAPKDDPKYILASDLDLMTIVAISLEGVMDSCDNNGDGKLTMGILDGNDELDCGFARTKDVIQRLLQSKVVKIKAGDAAKANALLDFFNAMFLTRIPAKVAMARGTTDGLLLHTLAFPFYNKATLGSMYGLIADILNSERARAAARGAPLLPGDPPSPVSQMDTTPHANAPPEYELN